MNKGKYKTGNKLICEGSSIRKGGFTRVTEKGERQYNYNGMKKK